MTEFELSVVLAEGPGRAESGEAFGAIAASCRGIPTEVLLVTSSDQCSAPASDAISVRIIRAPSGALVPVQWGVGIAAARAPVVACLSTEFLVTVDWAPTLLACLGNGVVGGAGALALVSGASSVGTAIYLLRFAAFLPNQDRAPRPVPNIPGDAAMYVRSAILAHPDLLAAGFWEVEFHRRFAVQGDQLLQSGESLVTYLPPNRLGPTLSMRYRHGYRHGTTRVLRHGDSVAKILIAAPVVPFVLMARTARRVRHATGGIRMLVRSAIPLLALAAAWSAGEALGAASAARRR